MSSSTTKPDSPLVPHRRVFRLYRRLKRPCSFHLTLDPPLVPRDPESGPLQQSPSLQAQVKTKTKLRPKLVPGFFSLKVSTERRQEPQLRLQTRPQPPSAASMGLTIQVTTFMDRPELQIVPPLPLQLKAKLQRTSTEPSVVDHHRQPWVLFPPPPHPLPRPITDPHLEVLSLPLVFRLIPPRIFSRIVIQ